jgi:betaine-aldehyde dehydrogenase
MATAPALRELRNFVNGEFKSAQEGVTLDIVNPSSGEAYAPADVRSAAVLRRCRARARRARDG